MPDTGSGEAVISFGENDLRTTGPDLDLIAYLSSFNLPTDHSPESIMALASYIQALNDLLQTRHLTTLDTVG